MLSSVIFAPESPVVLVGGADGVVRVYRVMNVKNTIEIPAESQKEKLGKVMRGTAKIATGN